MPAQLVMTQNLGAKKGGTRTMTTTLTRCVRYCATAVTLLLAPLKSVPNVYAA